jgi:hypothetical protein
MSVVEAAAGAAPGAAPTAAPGAAPAPAAAAAKAAGKAGAKATAKQKAAKAPHRSTSRRLSTACDCTSLTSHIMSHVSHHAIPPSIKSKSVTCWSAARHRARGKAQTRRSPRRFSRTRPGWGRRRQDTLQQPGHACVQRLGEGSAVIAAGPKVQDCILSHLESKSGMWHGSLLLMSTLPHGSTGSERCLA